MGETVSVFRDVFRNPDLRRMELAFAGFTATGWSTWIAILVYAFAVGGPTQVGLVSLLLLVPSAIVAPIAAQAGDRFPRARVLTGGYLLQAITMGATAAALLLRAPVPLVYGLATMATVSATSTRPTHGALLPAVTRTPEELVAANVVSGTIENVGMFAGSALTGVLLALAGPGIVWAVMAAVMLGSTLATARIRDRAAGDPGEGIDGSGTILAGSLAGFRTLAQARGPRLVIGLMFALYIELGSFDVLLVVLGLQRLGVGRAGTGFLFAAIGAGGIAGLAVTATLLGRRRLSSPFLAGIMVWAAALALVGVWPQFALALLLLGVAGAGRNVMEVSGRTLLQRTVPDDVLTRVLGVLEGLYNGSMGLGAVVAPLVIAALSIRGAFIAAGLALAALALACYPALSRIDARARPPIHELERLRAVPLFRPLRGSIIERLAEQLAPMSFQAGTVIMSAGDPADFFYIVDEGEVDVVKAGQRVARLGVGEHFGEIALLRRTPRTATVVALTPVRLLALDPDLFLRAVTGNARAHRVAAAVVEARL
jgi:MFS family permease